VKTEKRLGIALGRVMKLEKDEFDLLKYVSILGGISSKCRDQKTEESTAKLQKLPKRSRIKNQEIKNETEYNTAEVIKAKNKISLQNQK